MSIDEEIIKTKIIPPKAIIGSKKDKIFCALSCLSKNFLRIKNNIIGIMNEITT